jgi:hypothetical protein
LNINTIVFNYSIGDVNFDYDYNTFQNDSAISEDHINYSYAFKNDPARIPNSVPVTLQSYFVEYVNLLLITYQVRSFQKHMIQMVNFVHFMNHTTLSKLKIKSSAFPANYLDYTKPKNKI